MTPSLIHISLLVCLSAGLVGCGDLSESEARRKIEERARDGSWHPTAETITVLEDFETCGLKEGLWSLHTIHTPANRMTLTSMQSFVFCGEPGRNAPCENIEVSINLTEKGKALIEALQLDHSSYWRSPSRRAIMKVQWSTKSAVEITKIIGIRHVSEKTQRAVEFNWQSNRLGECIEGFPGFGITQLTLYNDGWRVDSIQQVDRKPNLK